MRIADLIEPKYRHLLWKDEIGDDFLLTDFGEIYLYSPDTIQLTLIFKKMTVRIKNMVQFWDYWVSGDNLYCFKTKLENLPEILTQNKLKKRFYLKGKRIRMFEERLGHKIIPFRPQHLLIKGDPAYQKYKNLHLLKEKEQKDEARRSKETPKGDNL